VSHHSPHDTASFSGIPWHMFAALRQRAEVRRFIEVPPFDLQDALSGGRAGRRELQEAGAAASRALRGAGADVVLCLGGAPAPYLDSTAPVVQWHDSTWHALLGLPFDDFAHAHPFLREWDQRTLDRCSLIAYAADWVREDTLAHYDTDPDRVAVVPFGANLPTPPDAAPNALAAARGGAPLRLAFVGVDWRRKGLVLAHRLTTRLNRLGVPTELTVAGPVIDGDATGNWAGDCGGLELAALRADPLVRLLGFVDKATAAGRDTLMRLLLDSHYLAHPAEFECFGVVLAEAAACGLPVLAVDAYGPRSVVRDGRTGHLFPAAGFVTGASAVVQAHLADPAAYLAEVRAARAEYEARLNWRSCVDRLLRLVA